MALSYNEVKAALEEATIKSGGKFIPFDVNYFSTTYAANLVNYTGTPLQYYVEIGAARGFQPNAWFDATYYYAKYPDVRTTLQLGTADLLVQYAKFGVDEGRTPSPSINDFNGARYLSDNPDVKAYVLANLDEFKTIDPATGQPVSDAQAELQGAIAHYIKFGALEGRNAYDTAGHQIPFTIYPISSPITPVPDDAQHTVNLSLNTNDGHTQLTGNNVVADGTSNNTLHLTGDAAIHINVTNLGSEVQGIDLNGDGVIAANGVENNVSGAGIFTAKNFTIFDAYARNPLNEGDRANNFLGDLYYEGTGYAGDGVSTNGNIVLGGLGADNIFGGLGNDFLAGGAVAPGRFIAQIVNGVQVLVDGITGQPVASWDPVAKIYAAITGAIAGTPFFTDQVHGGRNADFTFAELSALNNTDGNLTNYDGGNSTDSASAGLAESLSGANTQNNDWILLEAHDDNEPVTVSLDGGNPEDPTGFIALRDGTTTGKLQNIESIDASGNLYGFLNNSNAELGSRVTDSRIPAQVPGQENFSVGSTAQLNVIGNLAANIVVAGYDNDHVDGKAGDDILFGGNLGFLEQYKNNPNLLNDKGGLHLNVTPVGTVNDGKDVLNGGTGNDSIVFEIDGGQVNGGSSAPVDPQNRAPTATVVATGDTLYLDSFSVGRVDGATYTATAADPRESAAQAAALKLETTDNVLRFDLGLADDSTANPTGSSTLMYRNYGGADLANNVDLNGWTVHSADNTNYAPGVERTLVTGIESVITTGLGAIDYAAAGTNNPELHFNNQQNFQALNANVDLRGIDGGNDSGTSRVFGIYTATNFGNRNPDDPIPAAEQFGVNRADNVLYANTGNDVLEGRGGADFLSGGTGNDDFIFTAGDNTDIIWRQKDTVNNTTGASGADNLWDKDASGNYLYTQDFRPAAVVPNQSELDIKLEATNPGNQPTITLDHFAIRVGITEGQPNTGTLVEVTDLGTVGNFQQLADALDAKLNLVDPNLHAVWDGVNGSVTNGTLKVTDAIGRNISDTATEGYRFSASFTNLTVTNQAQFIAHPVAQVEDDRLIFESYLDRSNNTRVDTQHSDLTGLNANQLVVGFNTVDGASTTLTNNQEWRVQFENLRVNDKVSVSINGTVFTSTVKPGESTFDFAKRFATEINTTLQLDHNTSAGDVVAQGVHTTGQASGNDGVLVLTQGTGCDPLVFMHTPVVSVTNTNGATSGTWAIADTSGNSINLYQFDGRNGNLNAEDVLFVGATQDPHNSHATTAPVDINKTAGAIDQSAAVDSKEVLATALDKGGILNGINALIVATDTDPTHTFENVSTNGKTAALNGDDQLIGGKGDDIISAGTGDDVIIGSGGKDTVDGGGNWADPANSKNVITFKDVLLYQESDFVTAANPSASFTITLDPTLSLTPTNAGTVDIKDAKGVTLGTTTFTNIEEVRTTSNSANDTLSVVALSDAIAAKSGPSLENSVPTNEGVNIFLTQTGGDNYSVDINGDNVLQANEQHIAITDVCGEENVLAGKANDTVTIDDTQLGSNNLINLGAQTDRVQPSGVYTLADQGFDLVTYAADSIIKDAAQQPVTTFTVESAANTDTVSSTGGILGGKTITDTLIDVERVDFTAGAIPAGKAATTAPAGTHVDVLDVSSLASGATVNYGGGVAVGKSLGGGVTPVTSVAIADANVLSQGGVSATGNGLGNEKVIINGIQNLEQVKGGAGDDRVIVGNNLQTGIIAAANIGRATYLGSPTVQAQDIGLYQFDLGAGSDSLDYFQSTQNVGVWVDTSGQAASTDYVLVGTGELTAAGERIDFAANVEQFYGASTASGAVNTIDLTGATVDTKIEFSKYSNLTKPASNEIAEPNGNNGTVKTDLTRGILVSNNVISTPADPAFGTAYATFVDRSDTNPTGPAYWTHVVGNDKAETVVFSDNETGVAHTLDLKGGLNVVDFSALTKPIVASIGHVDVNSASLAQSSTANGDVINVTRALDPTAAQLTLIASATNGDTVSVQDLQFHQVNNPAPAAPTLSQVSASPEVNTQYHVVDLVNGKVIEDPNGQYTDAAGTLHAMGFVTNIQNFENVSNAGSADAVRITGNGSSNSLIGGNAGDWIQGGDGTGTKPYGGDTLTGNGGIDLFRYSAETQSPGGSVAGGQQSSSIFGTGADAVTAVVNSRDTITDFVPGTDKLVFVIGDNYDAVRVANPLPTHLNQQLNAAGQVSATFTPGDTTVDIAKDITNPATLPENKFDNYDIANTGVTLGRSDIALNVLAASGGQRLDASAGLSHTNLNAPSTDGLQVDFIYTAASQSQAAGYDQLIHFTSGQDNIDLSFLRAQDWVVTVPGGIYDANHDQVSDAIQGIINLPSTPILAYNSDAPGLFKTGDVYRAVAAQTTVDGDLNPSTTVFVDANHDGNYTVNQDMVISLPGIGSVDLNDFIFTDGQYTIAPPTPPNVAPTIAPVASTAAGLVNSVIALPDLTFTDPDSNLTVTVDATGGTVGGLTDADPATAGIQLTGTPAAVTTAFAAATFTGPAAGAANVHVSATDSVNVPATADIGVTLSAPNVAPTIAPVASTAAGVVNSVIDLPNLTFTDPDSNLTVTVNATGGTVGGLTDADPATAGIQLTGTPAAVTTAFAAATFTGPAAGAANVHVSATDSVNVPATADIGVTLNPNGGAQNVTVPVTGTPNPAAFIDGGALVNTSYLVSSGNFTASISGFGTTGGVLDGSHDVLDFPNDVAATVNNNSFTDGLVDVQWAFSGNVVHIELIGLSPALDAQLNSVGNFNTVFGAGTII